MRLPTLLRQIRLDQSMSLTDVEELTGISRGTLSQIETGRSLPADKDLAQLELAYGPAARLVRARDSVPAAARPRRGRSVTPRRCSATSPDLWTIRCQNPAGHAGPHRNNQTIWNDPDPIDLDTNTEAWVDGQVLLAHEREPEIKGLP